MQWSVGITDTSIPNPDPDIPDPGNPMVRKILANYSPVFHIKIISTVHCYKNNNNNKYY
jgi:hypothetical protein